MRCDEARGNEGEENIIVLTDPARGSAGVLDIDLSSPERGHSAGDVPSRTGRKDCQALQPSSRP